MEYGCLARFNNKYSNEVKFAKKHGFDFIQLWYDKNGLALNKDKNKINAIINEGFPSIIHAVLDINEIEEHIPSILKIMTQLKHDELIIHPICHSEKINSNSIFKLTNKVKVIKKFLYEQNYKLYVEFNSKLDPILCNAKEVEIFFKENYDVGFLLDIAHIDSIEELKEIVNIKYPNILHVADRRYSKVHEHLSIGKGDIDFKYIFKNILKDFDGKIIFEILDSNEIVQSMLKIKEFQIIK